MKNILSKPLFWSNVAAFLVTGLVTAGVAVAWNNPSSAPTSANGAISADALGNAVVTGLCFGTDCRGSWPVSGMQTFNASGNWTVPAGVRKVIVEVWGAGGAGANRPSTSFGYGGAGGGYGRDIISVNPGEVLTVTVGIGGVGSAGNGTDGGASSVSRGAAVLISATGGKGSVLGVYPVVGGTSSAPENISGESLRTTGGPYFGGAAGKGGAGGRQTQTVAPGCGLQGYAPGGGGGGGYVCTGGNGADGRVVIMY